MGDAGRALISADSAPTPIMLPKKLNVGVVGIGRMGRRHALNVLRMVPQANLLCACSPAKADLIWADEHLRPYGVQIYATFEEMIRTPGLEAVVIASATEFHMAQTVKAMDLGIHVLCEKPVCTSESELITLIDRAEKAPETTLMVAFVRRFDENYQDAFVKIQQGLIGRPLVVRSIGCEKTDISSYYKEYLKASGGIFVDSVIHDIDLAIFMLGEESRPKSVSASGLIATHYELAALGDADNAVGTCEFWDGKIAFFYNSRTAAHGYDNATEIFGTAGKLSINMTPRRNRVEICDGDGFVKVEPTAGWYDRYSGAFAIEMNSWVNAVLEGRPMPIPLRSSLTSLRIAMALQESLRTGQKIEFDESGLRKKSCGCICSSGTSGVALQTSEKEEST